MIPLANCRNERNPINWQTRAWKSHQSSTKMNWVYIKKQHQAWYNQIVRYPSVRRRRILKLPKKFTIILLSGIQKRHLRFSKLTNHLNKNIAIQRRKKIAKDYQVLCFTSIKAQKIFSLTSFQKIASLENLACHSNKCRIWSWEENGV